MKQYNKFLIHPTDLFNRDNFLPVTDEVLMIKERTANLPAFFKAEILISFLKEHTLQNDWIKANPSLTDLVTSGSLFQGSIESLFESSQNNPVFRQTLEGYLQENFEAPTL